MKPIEDRDDCSSCQVLYTSLFAAINSQKSDDEFSGARATGVCGWCNRKPEDIRRYNAATEITNTLEVVDGQIRTVRLESPTPLEDRWIACSPEQISYSLLDLQSRAFDGVYSPIAMQRISKFLQQASGK